MSEGSGSELILQVVRGEKPWTDLARLGITIVFEGSATRVDNPRGMVAVAQPVDIAQGLLEYRDRPDDLRAWARVILAGVPFLDLALDDQPVGDILLDALWDATFGRQLADEAIRTAEQLVGQVST